MITFNKQLSKVCDKKNNRLCIGLDVDNRKLEINTISYMDGFIKELIEATIDLCPVYKTSIYNHLTQQAILLILSSPYATIFKSL